MYAEEGRQCCPTNVLCCPVMRLEQQFSEEAVRPSSSSTMTLFSDKEKPFIAIQYKEMVCVNETFIGKLSTSFNLLPQRLFLHRKLHNYLVEPHQQELKHLWKYSQGLFHDHPVLLWLWHSNFLLYSCSYSFGNQDTVNVHLTVITSNGLDDASVFQLETADIFAAEKPSNYSFSKSALYNCLLTPQSTCDNVTKNGSLIAWGGEKRTFKQQKVEILSKAVQVGPIISIVFDFTAPRG